jgi:hypothetical protein
VVQIEHPQLLVAGRARQLFLRYTRICWFLKHNSQKQYSLALFLQVDLHQNLTIIVMYFFFIKNEGCIRATSHISHRKNITTSYSMSLLGNGRFTGRIR